MISRTGFVSNSSSSSFIIAFPKQPSSWTELQAILFGEKEFHTLWEDDSVATADLAQIIWWNIQLAERMDKEWVLEKLTYETEPEFLGVFQETPELKALNKELYEQPSPEREIELDNQIYDLRRTIAEQIYQRLFSSAMDNGAVAYTLNYSDHTNLGGHLDHGDVFENIPHIRINKH